MDSSISSDIIGTILIFTPPATRKKALISHHTLPVLDLTYNHFFYKIPHNFLYYNLCIDYLDEDGECPRCNSINSVIKTEECYYCGHCFTNSELIYRDFAMKRFCYASVSDFVNDLDNFTKYASGTKYTFSTNEDCVSYSPYHIELLMKNINVNRSYIYHFALHIGMYKCVKILLKQGVDPSFGKNASICYAVFRGHINIIKLLLKDNRVNPSDNDDKALKTAIVFGHIDIVKLLISDKRVDPTVYFHASLKLAIINKRIDIVKLLISDKRINPEHYYNTALYLSAFHESADIFKLLLTDKRVKNINDVVIIHILKTLKKYAMTNMLINDERYNPNKIFEKYKQKMPKNFDKHFPAL